MSRTRIVAVTMLLASFWPIKHCHSQDHYSLAYDPTSGDISVTIPDTLPQMTTLELVSKSSVFTGTRPDSLTSLFDVFVPTKLFKLDATGFGPIDFGPAMAPGLEFDFLANDLCANGSRSGGGTLGDVYLAGLDGEIRITGCAPPPPNSNQYRLDYDAEAGGLSFFVPEVLPPVTTLQIQSTTEIFTGERPDTLPGMFDVFRSDKLFKLDPNGFRTTDFGPVVPPNLPNEDLVADLCVVGTRKTGELLKDVYFGGARLTSCDVDLPDPTPPPPPRPVPPVEVLYDSDTGQLTLAVREDSTLSTFLMNSVADRFTGDRPADLSGQFDVFRSDRVFKLDVAGFHDVELGTITPGLSATQLRRDLCVAGTFLDGGDIDRVLINGSRILSACEEPSFNVPNLLDPFPPPPGGFGGVQLIYSPDTGDLYVVAVGDLITTLEIKSLSGLITGERPESLGGLFDVFNDDKIFKLDPAGFGDQLFQGVLPPGLSLAELQNELVIDGSTATGGAFFVDIGFQVFLPEPSSSSLAALACVGLLVARRKKQHDEPTVYRSGEAPTTRSEASSC
ncbi:MAG: hypothetical protein KDB27_33450 [Planctomycetales bacterium]|nr:hypothetical protein [Planctomycetales bacterium]